MNLLHLGKMSSRNFSEEARNRAEIYENHVGPLSQEIIAGAAGFFAMNRFEKEQRDKGRIFTTTVNPNGHDCLNALLMRHP